MICKHEKKMVWGLIGTVFKIRLYIDSKGEMKYSLSSNLNNVYSHYMSRSMGKPTTIQYNSVFPRHCFSFKSARVISLSGVQLSGFIHLSHVKTAIFDIIF